MTASSSVLGSIPVGSNPFDLEVDNATDLVYVSNFYSSNLSVISGATNTVVASIPVGTNPTGVAVDSATDTVYVANGGSDSVSVIDGATNATLATIPVGLDPLGVAVDSTTDVVYVANGNSNNVSVIAGSTDAVTASVPVGTNPQGVAIDNVTDTIYVTNAVSDTVSVIAGANDTVTATVRVGQDPRGVGVDAATDEVYVANGYSANVSVIDGTTSMIAKTITGPQEPYGVAVDSTTDVVFVVDTYTGNVSVIYGTTNNVIVNETVGSEPYGVGVDSTTNMVYVANWGSSSVNVLDGATNMLYWNTSTPWMIPSAIGVDNVTNIVYVGSNVAQNQLTEFNGTTGAVIGNVTEGWDPWQIAVDSTTNMIYAAIPNANASAINGTTGQLTTLPMVKGSSALGLDTATDTVYFDTGNKTADYILGLNGTTDRVVSLVPVDYKRYSIAVDTATDMIYSPLPLTNAHGGEVTVINGSTNSIVTNITVPEPGWYPQYAAVDSATDMIYVTTDWSDPAAGQYSDIVSMIDGATNQVVGNITVGRFPDSLAIDDATNTIYVGNTESNTVSVIDGATNTVTATILEATNNFTGAYDQTLAVNPVAGELFLAQSYSSLVFDVLSFHVNSALWVPRPAVSPSSLDAGQSVSVRFSENGVTGGIPPYSYSWHGLPSGCASSSTSFTCSPSTAPSGIYSVSLTVNDSSTPAQSRTSAGVTFTIFPDPAASVTPVASPAATDLGQPVTFRATVASSGSGGVVYSWSGLPPGCGSADALTVTCTPTATGTSTVTFHVLDSNGGSASSPPLHFTVSGGPTISVLTASRTTLDVGQSTVLSATATNGTGLASTYSWSGLPTGCTSSGTLTVSCSPTAAGTYTVTASVTDSNHRTVTTSPVTLTVSPALGTPALTESAPSTTTGSAVVFQVSVSGGTAPLSYVWSGLPTGCGSTDSPTLVCTPSATGTFAVKATVTDDAGASTSAAAVTLSVTSGPSTSSSSVSGLEWGLTGGVAILAIVVAVLAAFLMVRRGGKNRSGEGSAK